MTITFAPSSPHSNVGPGVPFTVDFTHVASGGNHIEIQVFYPASGGSPFWVEVFPNISISGVKQFIPGTGTRSFTAETAGLQAQSDDSVNMAVVVRNNTGTLIDFAQQTVTWETQEGVAQLLSLQQTNGAKLNATQSAQLTETHDNTVTDLSLWDTFTSVTLPSLNDVLSGITTNTQTIVTTASGVLTIPLGSLFEPAALDAFTLVEITGGETCDPVFAGDLEFHFGIVVRSTTIPDHYGLGGYDGRHYEPSLALLNVFRGTEMVARIPIHVADFMLTPVPGQNNSTEAQIVYLAVAPNLSLEVWWGQGVCGRVYLLRLP